MTDLKLFEMLNNLDYRKIASEEASLTKASSTFLIFYFTSIWKVSDQKRTQELLEKHSEQLEKNHLKNLLKAFCLCDLDQDYSEPLYQVINCDLVRIENPVVKNEALATVGYLLMSLGNFQLARHYYKSASDFFISFNIPSLAWRYTNNCLICDMHENLESRLEPKSMQVEIQKIVSSFHKLPKPAQQQLVPILNFQLLFCGETSTAHKTLDQIIKRSNLSSEDNLYLYRHYTKQLLSKRSESKFPDSSIKNKLALAQSSHLKNIEENLEIMKVWDQELHYDIKYMLCDLLLANLFKHSQHKKLLNLFSQFSDTIFKHWGVVIPPRSLYYFPHLSHLKLQTRSDQISQKLMKGLHPTWRQKIQLEEKKIVQEQLRHTIFIDDAQKIVRIGKQEFNFARKKAALHLLLSLNHYFSNKALKAPLHSICSEIYPSNTDNEPNLKVLAHRLKEGLGHDIFWVRDNFFYANTKYLWRKTSNPKKKIKNRQQSILSFLKKNKKAGLTVEDLAFHIKCSKKTINNDLKILIESELVLKTGNARATRYFIKSTVL